MNQPKPSTIRSDLSVIQPGATIGMVGGGQLGRMFAMAAAQLGYRVVVFCDDEDSPAAQVAHAVVLGELTDQQAIERFAGQCDVITLEFENIPATAIAQCGRLAPTYPAAAVLATAQDRILEKSTLREAGLPVTPFAVVNDSDTLITAGATLGWPMIVKTARSGYDGKGQYRVNAAVDADTVPWDATDVWISEQYVRFEREVSVIVARTADGRTRCFPIFENLHQNHILDLTICPATMGEALTRRAKSIATEAAATLGVVGLLCVEMFVVPTPDGFEVLINEVAPRPHNSGHLSIEACHTSQFEQHVRAICGLPLGNPELIAGGAAMMNLLGDLWMGHHGSPPWDKALSCDTVRLHLYGKASAKAGRKMGHLTAIADSAAAARRQVQSARQVLEP